MCPREKMGKKVKGIKIPKDTRIVSKGQAELLTEECGDPLIKQLGEFINRKQPHIQVRDIVHIFEVEDWKVDDLVIRALCYNIDKDHVKLINKTEGCKTSAILSEGDYCYSYMRIDRINHSQEYTYNNYLSPTFRVKKGVQYVYDEGNIQPPE